LPEEIRNKKYDVIVSNPPYCDLCADGNVRKKIRPYFGYPAYADLAQCFIKWAYDHLSKFGVCGFNTSDTWLNDNKIGSNTTKEFIFDKMIAIEQDNEIKTYSMSDGGNINTMIFAFLMQESKNIEYKHDTGVSIINHNLKDMKLINFLRRHESIDFGFKNKPLSHYCSLATIRNAKQPENHEWHSRVMLDNNYDTLIFNYIMTQPNSKGYGTFRGGFKLVYDHNRYSSKTWKLFAKINGHIGIWLVGYLNTAINLEHSKKLGKIKWDGSVRFGTNRAETLPVPDYDWYLANRLEQTQAFLSWVEMNMIDKDKFLAGIDEEFDKLIGD